MKSTGDFLKQQHPFWKNCVYDYNNYGTTECNTPYITYIGQKMRHAEAMSCT